MFHAHPAKARGHRPAHPRPAIALPAVHPVHGRPPPRRATGAAFFGETCHWHVSYPSSPPRAAGAFAPTGAGTVRAPIARFRPDPLGASLPQRQSDRRKVHWTFRLSVLRRVRNEYASGFLSECGNAWPASTPPNPSWSFKSTSEQRRGRKSQLKGQRPES